MSTDRPLATRYGEPVFPEASWSPTVAQALTLLNLKMGEELPGALIDSFVSATKPKLKETTLALLVSHNKVDLEIRKATSVIVMQSASLSVLHSPNEPFFQEEMGERKVTLMVAVATIGLQMLEEEV